MQSTRDLTDSVDRRAGSLLPLRAALPEDSSQGVTHTSEGSVLVIVSRISGGLGNQMFQYAAGRRLADRLGTSLMLDLSSFRNDPLRAFALDRYELRTDAMTDAMRARLPVRFGGSWWRRLLRVNGAAIRVLREKGLGYQPGIESAGDDTMLVGYWQSERYFSDLRPQLLREFALTTPVSGRDAEVAAEMAASISVAIHVRRGDYVSNTGTHQTYGTCDPDYYQKSADVLAREIGPIRLFVFSDDPDWCRASLRFEYPMVIVDHNDAARSCEDLRLMSQAQHFIIANSSFSWWAAWLATTPGKIVCAPKRWFRSDERDETDIVPTVWRRV